MQTIPRAEPTDNPCPLKSPQTVAARGSTDAIIAALPGSVLLSPKVYRRKGKKAETSPTDSTPMVSTGMLDTFGMCFTSPGISHTKSAPNAAKTKAYVLTVKG